MAQALSNGTVQGGVYIDRNMDGTFGASASGQTAGDTGLPGVTVRAFDSTGTQVGSTVVGADGTYTLNVTNAATADVRVEFEVPEGYEPTIVTGAGAYPSGAVVRFVTLNATNINLGVQIPMNYCDNNTSIAGVCIRQASTAYVPTGGVVKMTNYTTPTTSFNISTKQQTGSTWGLGWQRSTGLIWNSAMIRSHSGLGPKGVGGVYVSKKDGTLVASFDLVADKGLVLEPSAGYYSDANRGVNGTNAVHHDPRAFSGVGKASFGDLDISLDGRYLWITNLYERKIHRMEITGTAAAPTLGPVQSWSIDDGYSCGDANSVLRPWALEPNVDGTIKVGAVCTNEGLTPSATSYAGAGVILQIDPSQSGAAAWTTLTSVSFAYTHHTDFGAVRWMSWSDDWAKVKPMSGPIGSCNCVYDWNQPVITDIETMRDGSMVLGVLNRMNYQLAEGKYGPVVGDTALVSARTEGDALLLCKTAGGWAQESGGTCTGINTYSAGTRSAVGSRTDEFFDDVVKVVGAAHPEQVIGGLAIAPPNYPQNIAISSMDPGFSIGKGGITWKSLANGNEWYDGATKRQIELTSEFGKAGGMGDLEVLCDAAPLQIGNRLWKDTDGDGIQDPGETPIAGATVRLYDASGTLVGTAVTNAAGEYYFNSTLSEAASGGATPDAVGGNLRPNTAYTIRVDNPTDYATGGPLAGLGPTTGNATSGTATDQDDEIDSDASAAGTGTSWGVNQFPQITVAPHAPGAVDHSLDAGFVPLVGMGNYVWDDADADGVQDPGETPIAGVGVTLYQPDGITPALNAFGQPATATTAADGSYFIDGLKPGNYRAKFSPPSGYVFSPTGAGTSATDSNPDSTGLTPEFTLSGSATGDTTTDSNPSTLAALANLTIDAGLIGAVSVGNYVWFDTNNDGLQDASDIPLAGVTLTIAKANGDPVFDVFGNPVGPTTTSADGSYLFDNLPYGTYKVSVVTPTGLQPALAEQGGDSQKDSSTGTATSSALSTPGAEDLSLDFGFWAPYPPPVSLGNYVWLDTDADGIQDPGESGIAGAVLTLTDPFGNPVLDVFGNPVAPITTGADGKYLFEGLPAGQYRVSITYPAGYGPTKAGQGGDTAADSSTNSATSSVLSPGQQDLSLDFGVVPKVSVGNYVWFDANNDGMQDASDIPMAGVTLTISNALNPGAPVYDTAGNPVTTTTTDADGFYLFDNLPYGTYKVTVTTPTGMQAAQTGQGTPTTDSSSGSETSAALDTPGEEDLSLDFGFYRPRVSVGDLVWYDIDNNGLQDAGEAGLAGVRMSLTDLAGNPVDDIFGNEVADVLTDANGNYLFENLPPGQYKVSAATPNGFLPTLQNQGGNPGLDSSTDSATSANLTNDGDADLSLDFGFYVPPPAVGTRVWVDLDYDGLQDPDEPGIAGVTLTLKDSGGNPVTTTTTDADGNYVFDADDGVAFGSAWTVEITYPAGYAPTKVGNGTNPLDSSTNSATSIPLSITDRVDFTLDFGVVPVVSVGDYVWEDANRDGLQDESDIPIANVTLTISNADDPSAPVYDVDGNLVTTTTTNASGYYLFDNLPPGRYKVTVTPPAGYVATDAGAGSDTGLDSSTGSATSGVLDEPNESDLTLDFGFVKPSVSVGNYVWLDLDRDGIQDGTEDGIEGVTLTITNADDPTAPIVDVVTGLPVTTTTTDADGHYLFDNLPPGRYKVTVTPPTGLAPTTAGDGTDPVDSSTDSATSRSLLTNGESDLTLDFGFVVPSVSVGDYVWLDTNRNGIQDEGEPGIAGVELTITNAEDPSEPVLDVFGNPVGVATTDADGKYLFENLPPGTYTVTVSKPPVNLVPTEEEAGTDPNIDSSTDSATSEALSIDGSSDLTLDFGFVTPLVAVGDYVWVDLDADGIQDEGEPPLAGVKILLLEADGTTPAKDGFGNPVPAVYTDAAGLYFIDNLSPGDYTIKFELPAGYTFTTDAPLSGDTPGNDSNPDPVTGLTPVFTLNDSATGDMIAAGSYTDLPEGADAAFVNPTIDAGVIAPIVAVGDYVWRDDDLDGIQDADEPAIKGVKVELFNPDGTPATDADGNPVSAVYTDASGKYFIDNLIPGDYYITFGLPDGYSYTLQGEGADRTKDSNPDGTGKTPVFTIAATASGTTVADTDPLTKATLVNPTIDAGYTQAPVGVGDYTWLDTNRDGKQGADEPPLANVFVQLLNPDGTLARDADGVLVPYAYTDADGFYFFDNLRPGEYRVQFLLPAGYTFTGQFSGSDGEIDSNANVVTGLSAVFTIAPNATGDTIAAADYDDLPAGADAAFVNPTIDAGVIAPVVAVGNYTWIDADRDGVQDASEVPLKSVTVRLYNADGSPATDYDGDPVAPVVTDEYGYYLFDNLLPGDYYIEFDAPPGYTLTTDTPTAGGTVANDSNPDPDTGRTPVFTIAAVVSGTTVPDTDPANEAVLVNPTIDAGFIPPLAAVGDYVWQDRNKNGVQDAGELPLEGTKVQLLRPDGSIARDADGDPVPAVYTDGDGFYFIDNLLPGDYRIQFTLPDGYTFTDQFGGSDAALDSNADPALGLTPMFTIGAYATGDTIAVDDYDDLPAEAVADFVNPTIDAGVIPPVVAVGDYTWIDADADGVQDLGEAALAGVKVELLNPDGSAAMDYDGNPVAPVFTDEFGYYFIDNLIPGEYQVRFTAPSGYDITVDGSGLSSTDSNPDPDTGVTPTFTLYAVPMGNTVYDTDTDTLAQLVDPTIDAGFVPLVAIGDYTWVDLDKNGRQDAGEPALAGVKVTLYGSDGATAAKDADGNTVPFATTDANGFYFFDNLLPGSYTIRFELPDGYVFTTSSCAPCLGSADDSNAGDTIGATDYGWTSVFSVAPTASGDTVSVDTYSSEPTGTKARFVNPTIDAGAAPLVGMGDYTWIDSDRDGLQDPTELPLKDVVVKLYVPGTNTQATDAYGNPAQATTDATGFYFVDDLLPGDYYATFTLPDPIGYAFTLALATSTPLGLLGPLGATPDTALDSNPNRYTGVTDTFSIAPEADGDTVAQASATVPTGTDALFVNPTIDAGIVPVVAIANYYWYDKDADGVRDPGEDPVPGSSVTLTDPNGDPVKDADGNPIPPATTDANGYFLFDNLVPGRYRLKFTPPPGYAFTSKGDDDTDDEDSNANPDGVTDPFAVEAAPQGATEQENANGTKALLWNPNVGAGLVPVVAIGDLVWDDRDEDGRQDKGEPGLPGVKVELLEADGVTIATGADGLPVPAVYTNASGKYLFDNLVPGQYRVRFTLPPLYQFTVNDATIDNLDSDADTVTGVTPVFTVYPSTTGNTIADTNPATKALFVDPTIDAGIFGGDLPVTGGSAGYTGPLAALLSFVGALLLLVTRRRRAADAR